MTKFQFADTHLGVTLLHADSVNAVQAIALQLYVRVVLRAVRLFVHRQLESLDNPD